MMQPPSPESNGLARRRRRRRPTNEDDSHRRSLTKISITEEEESTTTTTTTTTTPTSDSSNTTDTNGSDGGEALNASLSGNYLDKLLQNAYTAMGLTPVHNSNHNHNRSSNNNNTNNKTNGRRHHQGRSHSESDATNLPTPTWPTPISNKSQNTTTNTSNGGFQRVQRRNSTTTNTAFAPITPSYYSTLHDPTKSSHSHSSHNNNNRGGDNCRDSFELKQNAIHSLQSDGTLEALSALENLHTEQSYNSQQSIWTRLAIQSSHPDVAQKELIQRSTFLVISSLTVGAGTLWGGMYVILGEWTAACMPFLYSTCMSLVLMTFICGGRDVVSGLIRRCFGRLLLVGGMTNKVGDKGGWLMKLFNKGGGNKGGGMGVCIDAYDIYVECQLGLIMACPFAVHIALGGVENSGGVMLWSFLCPMGAAFFRSAKESLIWFYIYMSVCAILLTGEIYYAEGGQSEVISQVYFLMNIMGCMGVVYSAVFLFARELEREYTKSEEVLLNILPSKIVKRIKRGEFPIVDHVSAVTILFADLVGFTKASAELHPNFLVGLFLRDIFHAFDELVGKHGLEKIKTIGDAYMVVGGLDHSDGEEKNRRRRSTMPTDELPSHGDSGDHHHPTSIMMLAHDMFQELKRINKKYNLDFSLRIGIHKGPVVAGVLGLKRFTYDVWGDSVNTASRMESNGVPNLIHLSSDMYQAVDGLTNDFEFTCCGNIQIKGKGEMTTYLAKPLR